MKRLLALFLTVALCLALVPGAFAANPEEFVIGEHNALTEYNGPGGHVVVPDGVELIYGAFRYNEDITSVVLPEGVTYLNTGAFYNCKNLETIVLPSTLTTIMWNAFYGCSSLREIVLPEHLEAIDARTFRECTSLTEITIPASVKSIGEQAFCGCTSLKKVTFSQGLEEIGINAFAKCFALEEVRLPEGLKTIKGGAFNACRSLSSASVPDSVTQMAGGVFAQCTALAQVKLPSKLKSIPDTTFSRCVALESVDVPETVTSIGKGAFEYCYKLTEIVLPDGVTKIKDGAFSYCRELTAVNFPDSVVEIGQNVLSASPNVTRVDLPLGLQCIDPQIFFNTAEDFEAFYPGTRVRWDQQVELTRVVSGVDPTAKIRFGSIGPEEAVLTPENTAYASTQKVLLDDKPVELQAYALKDPYGNYTNYVKLRDVAMLLNGTPAQFEVTWDGAIRISKGPYTPNGSEMKTPFSGDRPYYQNKSVTKYGLLNLEADSFVLMDDQGGGYTYYKLRDLGINLGFNVGWTAETGIFIESDKAYDYSN